MVDAPWWKLFLFASLPCFFSFLPSSFPPVLLSFLSFFNERIWATSKYAQLWLSRPCSWGSRDSGWAGVKSYRGYTFYRLFSPDKLVRNEIFSNLDLHPCSIRRSGTLAGGGPEGIYSVIAESVFYFILSSNHWPEVAYELRWFCIVINIPKELFT